MLNASPLVPHRIKLDAGLPLISARLAIAIGVNSERL
jgi:hypothetical protein